MPILVTCPCGKALRAADTAAGRDVRCPVCGATVTVPRAAPLAAPKVPATGPERVVAALNDSDDADTLGQQAARAPGIPIGALGCALPVTSSLLCFMLVFLATGLSEPRTMTRWTAIDWTALGCMATLAVPATLAFLWRMRGKWTIARAVWTAFVVGVFALVSVAASRDLVSEERLVQRFRPLIVELGDTASLGSAERQYRRGKLVPLVRNKRGEHRRRTGLPLRVEYGVYRALPAALRAGVPEDAQTIVLIDYGYSYVGTYKNNRTGGSGGAYAGMCELTVIDRSSRSVTARRALRSSDKPPNHKITAMDWYGPQPSEAEIVAYLESLPEGP
jgi:hypothetical protein